MSAFIRKFASPSGALRFLVCFAILVGTGCGKGKKGTLSGKVTINGKDVTGGAITLSPEGGKGAVATIPISADGTFSSGGIAPGKYKVAIETESVKKQGKQGYQMPKDFKPPKDVPMPSGGKPDVDTSKMPVYVPIPPKYSKPETSGLTCEVTGGKQEINFPLTK